jgi:hypothetical protein
MQATIIVAVVAFCSSSLATIAIYSNNSTVSPFCAVALAVVVYLALSFSPCELTAFPPSAMDPDTSEPAPAIPLTFGVPVAMASAIGPMIFQFYPLPGVPSEGDHFYYNQEVDLSCGNFAALVAYTAHYDLPLVVYACPNIAAFQVAHPRANICPFSEVSPRILSRGRELFALAHSAAQVASVVLLLVAHSTPSSRKGSSSRGLSSLLSPTSFSAASRGADPPSLPCSSISLLAIPEGRFSQVGGFPHVGPHHPDPDGINAPSPSGGSWSRL